MGSSKPDSRQAADGGQAIARVMADSCLAMRVRRLNRIITRTYTAALRPLGLTQAQLSLLVAIELRAPVSAAAIGRLLDLEKSTLSRNLARLAANGWVRSHPELELTARGRSILAEARPLWLAVQERMERALGADASRALERMSAQAQSILPD